MTALEAVLAAVAPLLAAPFTLWGSPVTWAEIVAFVLAIWMVVCNWRVNPLAWPLAIASSLLYGLLFAKYKLYGEASLQMFFVVHHHEPAYRHAMRPASHHVPRPD